MLRCVYHSKIGQQVVSHEKGEELLKSGEWFNSPWEAKKAMQNDLLKSLEKESKENGKISTTKKS